jgi:integrase
MPTVYRRRNADGTQAETFTADVWVGGKKFSRGTGQTTRRDAEKRAGEIEREIREELARRYEPLTIDGMMAKYWEEHAGPLPSAKSVKYHIERLLEIIGRDKPLAELGNADVNRYVTTRSRMPVSRATINRELDVLQSAYCMARDRWEHPVRAIRWRDHRFPADDKRTNTLSLEESREAIRLMTPKSKGMADAIELTIYTGIRKNELATITKGRVDLPNRRMTVLAKRKARQGHRERTVYLSTPAVALLSERILPGMDDDAFLFNLTNARKLWEWVRAEIGREDVRWHDLRHTHGTLLGQTTDNTRIIQTQLGHTNAQTSLRYVHTDHAQVVEAVETIPALSERKVVGLRDAENQPKPPAQTTSKGSATD